MKKNSFSFAAAFVTLALFGGATTSVGCGGSSVPSLCADFCACERCTSNDLQKCEDEGEAASDAADAAGCSSEFDAVVDCAIEKVTCSGDNVLIKGCDSEQAALAKCPGLVTPQQKTDCQKAGDLVNAKLNTCGVAVTVTPTGTTSCSDEQGTGALCNAACFDAASCDFLKCAVGNDMAACSTMNPNDSTGFGNCSSACSPTN